MRRFMFRLNRSTVSQMLSDTEHLRVRGATRLHLVCLLGFLLSACAGADGGATAEGADDDGARAADARTTDWGRLEPDRHLGSEDARITVDLGEPPPPDTGPLDAYQAPVDAAPLPPPMPDAATPPPPPDAAPPPPPGLDCEYRARDFDAALREYDVMGQPDARLAFEVPNLPDPGLVDSAVLVFAAFDLDHPGEEGFIRVNGNGRFDIPTDGGGDNVDSVGQVNITGTTVGGVNRIEFGPSATQPRTFYRIGRVALHLRARVAECVAPPPPPPREAVTRSVGYRQARYTQRNNWVVRCNDYAFTARGAEQAGDDCEGAYNPDGSRRGTAIFAFGNLVPATYEVVIRSRHTANRNPRGALFIVDGEERRISQVSDRDRTDDVWGQKHLGGDIQVVLDSTREAESDSVISVTLRPIGP